MRDKRSPWWHQYVYQERNLLLSHSAKFVGAEEHVAWEARRRKAAAAQSAVSVPATAAMTPPKGAPRTITPRFTERLVALMRAMSLSGVTACW